MNFVCECALKLQSLSLTTHHAVCCLLEWPHSGDAARRQRYPRFEEPAVVGQLVRMVRGRQSDNKPAEFTAEQSKHSVRTC